MTANILFGISMPVFKYLLSVDVPPEAITIMRASFACVMFWLTSLFMPIEKVAGKDLAILFVCAMCGVGINQYLFVLGLKSSSPVDASIIATSVPIFVMLLAAIILKEPVTAKKASGVMLGVCGGLLLVFSSIYGETGNGTIHGDMLMLVNQLMYSVYLVLSKPLTTKYSSVMMMKWMFLFSTLILTPFCAGTLAEVPTFHAGTFSSLSDVELESLIRPCGFAKRKSATIIRITNWFRQFEYDVEKIKSFETDELRNRLLSIKGIGNETSDVISVYAFHKPVFIVDAYTRRFLMKLGFNFDTDEDIKRFFEKDFRKDYRLFGWNHWLILQHGIKHCKKTPICHDCIFKNKCTSVVPIME